MLINSILFNIVLGFVILYISWHIYNKIYLNCNSNGCMFGYNIKEGYGTGDLSINVLDIKTDDKILVILRNMLQDIDSLFNTYDITYWIDGGTLLGAIRHENVIPWDDDADLSILSKDEFQFLSLEPRLNEMGYGLGTFWGGYKIYPLNGMDIKDYNRNWKWNKDPEFIVNEKVDYKYPFIDIFIVAKKGNKYEYLDPRVQKMWPNYYHEEKDLLPLKRYKFANFELTGPANPKPYLDRSYGKDWPTVGYRQYDHQNQRLIKKVKFTIPKPLLSQALQLCSQR